MTVPENMSAKFSQHTKSRIESVDPEFPKETKLISLEFMIGNNGERELNVCEHIG